MKIFRKEKMCFHPGDILTIIRADSIAYSSKGFSGALELVGYYLRHEPEYYLNFFNDAFEIYGLKLDLYPLFASLQDEMRRIFPAMAAFSDDIPENTMTVIFSSKEKSEYFFHELEMRFGDTLQITPISNC